MFRFLDSYTQFTPVTAEHRRQQAKQETRARFRIDIFHLGLAIVADLVLVFLLAGYYASTLRFLVLGYVLDQWLLAFLLMPFLPHSVPLSMVYIVKMTLRGFARNNTTGDVSAGATSATAPRFRAGSGGGVGGSGLVGTTATTARPKAPESVISKQARGYDVSNVSGEEVVELSSW